MNLNCEVDSPMHKAMMKYRAAIIEECALRFAQDKRDTWDKEAIIAAIRALKDKP